MIQRVVRVKLKDPYRGEDNLELVAEHTREVLGGIPLVRHIVVGIAADARTRREWDLLILLRFQNLDDVETYRDERTHRAYVDVYLRPMVEQIRVWNFDIPEEI